MKKIIALLLVFTMILPMCLVSADDFSVEEDYGSVEDENMMGTTGTSNDDAGENAGTDTTTTVNFSELDFDAMFEQPLVEQDVSDQMNEAYAKYGTAESW